MHRAWSPEPVHGDLETLLELGEGGMAKAYLARTLGPGGFQRLVVIKRLNLDLLGVPDAVERFLAEARIAARIHHANVVGTQQVGKDAAGPFIVLDYIEGGSLDDLVSARAVPLPVILRMALDVLAGLRAVHEARDVDGRPLAILHRDISLQNILVSAQDGVARLSDFGVAKSALGSVRTEEGVFVGKLCYFPPEYLRREPIGASLDVYALGVTLWLALTRHELWEGASEAQVIRAILDNGIPPLDRQLEVAPQIAELVMRACERDPHRRFQSAREMADVLEGFERDRGWLATHAEVAALVENVLGRELAQRRETVARLVRSPERVVAESHHALSSAVRSKTLRSPSPPSPVVLGDVERVASTVRQAGIATPKRPSRLGWVRYAALGAPLALVTAALIAAVLVTDSRDEPALEQATEIVLPTPRRELAPVEATRSEPSQPEPEPSPENEPEEGPVQREAQSRARGPGSLGVAHAAQRADAGRKASVADEENRGLAPMSLRKRNPYRTATSSEPGRNSTPTQ